MKNLKLTAVLLLPLAFTGASGGLNTETKANQQQSKNDEKMITVRVTYGVKKEFAAKNMENIALFMKDFKAMDTHDFWYNVYTLEDGSFVHISSYANEEIQQKVLNTPSFKEFQRQRDESGLTTPHHFELLHSVAATHEAFTK